MAFECHEGQEGERQEGKVWLFFAVGVDPPPRPAAPGRPCPCPPPVHPQTPAPSIPCTLHTHPLSPAPPPPRYAGNCSALWVRQAGRPSAPGQMVDTSWSDLACDSDTVRMCVLEGMVPSRVIPAGTSSPGGPCTAGPDSSIGSSSGSALMGGLPGCGGGSSSDGGLPAATSPPPSTGRPLQMTPMSGIADGSNYTSSVGITNHSSHAGYGLAVGVSIGIAGLAVAALIVALWYRRWWRQRRLQAAHDGKPSEHSTGELECRMMMAHPQIPASPYSLVPFAATAPPCGEVAGGRTYSVHPREVGAPQGPFIHSRDY